MMRREDAIARLKAAESEFRAFRVRGLYLFGSVARDEAGADSDIDIFVEPDSRTFHELANDIGTYDRLTSMFSGVKVGYATRDGLSKYARPEIEREAIRIF